MKTYAVLRQNIDAFVNVGRLNFSENDVTVHEKLDDVIQDAHQMLAQSRYSPYALMAIVELDNVEPGVQDISSSNVTRARLSLYDKHAQESPEQMHFAVNPLNPQNDIARLLVGGYTMGLRADQLEHLTHEYNTRPFEVGQWIQNAGVMIPEYAAQFVRDCSGIIGQIGNLPERARFINGLLDAYPMGCIHTAEVAQDVYTKWAAEATCPLVPTHHYVHTLARLSEKDYDQLMEMDWHIKADIIARDAFNNIKTLAEAWHVSPEVTQEAEHAFETTLKARGRLECTQVNAVLVYAMQPLMKSPEWEAYLAEGGFQTNAKVASHMASAYLSHHALTAGVESRCTMPETKLCLQAAAPILANLHVPDREYFADTIREMIEEKGASKREAAEEACERLGISGDTTQAFIDALDEMKHENIEEFHW